jgi:SAM-dependent methyltransferase
MSGARYDAVAEFYEAGWTDVYDDSASVALFDLLGPVAGLSVLDIACGHGRITRELARRGAQVVGVDLSAELLEKGKAIERANPLGVHYRHADVSSDLATRSQTFDAVSCSFGLSDIDDLDGCIHTVAAALRPVGRFVCSLLHPCFPGSGETSGSWPTSGSYYDEGRWVPAGRDSTLRRQVGANHRTLSTYMNAFRRFGLSIDALIEPLPPLAWSEKSLAAANFPVFLVVRCMKD